MSRKSHSGRFGADSAATLSGQLAKAGVFGARRIDVLQIGTVAAWTRLDGNVRLLAGNLEEGLRDDADRTRHMTLNLPPPWQSCRWPSAWELAPPVPYAAQIRIDLPAQASALFSCDQ